MDKQVLMDQIDYVQARIEEIDKQIINSGPNDKGYTGLIDSYNKWIDRYDILIDKLDHFEDVEIEKAELKKKERIDIIFRSAELGVKIFVPVVGASAAVAIANLSYVKDANLELCNGRIFGNVKELFKIITMKM